MLILTRKPGEKIYIGDKIKVTIVELKGNQIRIGIDAPSNMRIYREEIYLQILEENKRAAESASDQLGGLDSLAEQFGAAEPGQMPKPGALKPSQIQRGEKPANVVMKRQNKRGSHE